MKDFKQVHVDGSYVLVFSVYKAGRKRAVGIRKNLLSPARIRPKTFESYLLIVFVI